MSKTTARRPCGDFSPSHHRSINGKKLEFEAVRQKQLHPKNGGNLGHPVTSGRHKAREEVAQTIGLSTSQVENIEAIAEKIADDVQDSIAEMPAADSGVELDALAGLGPVQKLDFDSFVNSIDLI